jgi:2-dehydropantoate 2-reductase
MRILILGAGVIASVYAGRFTDAGHAVTLCARGRRLKELRECGLILEDAWTGRRTSYSLPAIAVPDEDGPWDVVLVAVRREQMLDTLPLLDTVHGDVLFFGNAAGLTAQLADRQGAHALFGFPAAGGVRDGVVVRYVLIRQQKTMLADADLGRTHRVRKLAETFQAAGFRVHVATDAEAWLTAHAAFVVPIMFALYRVDVQPQRLAADDALLTMMVRATRQAFRVLQATGNTEIPRNLRALYLLVPERFSTRYWGRTLVSARGELWFAAHTRAAPEEMVSLADALRAAIRQSGCRAPDLEALLADSPA